MTNARNMITPPPDGVYFNVPADQYHAWNAIGASTLCESRISMARMRWAMQNPTPATPAMDLGTIIHAAILEPARFLGMLVEPPINEKTGEPYGRTTKAWAEHMARHPGRFCLAKDEIDRVQGMIDSTRGTPLVAGALYHGSRQTEVSIVATCPETGLRLKCRPDCLWHDSMGPVVSDLKSNRPTVPASMLKTSQGIEWMLKAAHYQYVHELATGKRPRWNWVVAFNEPPYESFVIPFDAADESAAAWHHRQMLERVAECVKSGKWPTGGEDVVRTSGPDWFHAEAQSGAEMEEQAAS